MSVSLSTGVAATATLQFLDSNIENLDISDADGVEDWHERFEQYCLTNPLVDSSNKTAHYLTKIGKPGYRLLKDLAFPDPVASKDVNDLQKLFLRIYNRPLSKWRNGSVSTAWFGNPENRCVRSS